MKTKKTKEKKHRYRSKLRLRLMVAIPLLLLVIVGLLGTMAYCWVKAYFEKVHIPQEVTNKTLFYLQIATIIGSVFSIIAGLVLGYTVVTPVKEVTLSADAIARGDFSRTVDINAHVELDELGDSFNRMVSSLRDFIYERNRFILESMSAGVITLDKEGRVITANPSAENILGVSSDELLWQTMDKILPPVPENQAILKMFSESLKFYRTYSSEELDIVTRDKKNKHIGITISLLKNREGATMGIVATFKDLTPAKQMQQQLQRSDRLAAIGTLVAGLAHELRNPLGAIRGLAQLLMEDLPSDDPKQKYVSVILKEIDRLNQVTEELLSFTRVSPSGYVEHDLNEVLKEAFALAKERPIAKRDITITEVYDKSIPPIKMEREKLLQAFLNICINAFEAVDDKGQVGIFSRLGPASKEYPVPNKGMAIIEIKNTGLPIPPENKERIFDPFFTTKEGGTGLGLSIAHHIIAAHSGQIEVESEPGRPTVFRVLLPIT